MAKKVTQKQAEAVLVKVAEWLGKAGYGQEDAFGKYVPVAPTGPEAHRHGVGPELVMDWDWPGEPTPTILLEGGPYDWAIQFPDGGVDEEFGGTFEAVKLPKGVRVEPYAGYALCIYRED